MQEKINKIANEILKIARDRVKGLTITAPTSNGEQWAKRYWDTYDFDYLTGARGRYVFVWPDGQTMKQLKKELDDDDIEYSEDVRYI